MARTATPTPGTVTGTATVNGGEPIAAQLRITQERIDISTNLPKPDPRWTFTDAASHFHARSEDGELPTLIRRMEHVPCGCSDCDSEGYDVTHYHCRICDEEIKPGTIAGPHYETMPGMVDWELVIQAALNSYEEVSVRYVTSGGEYFGVAVPYEMHVESGGRSRTMLHGVSLLGHRRTVVPSG